MKKILTLFVFCAFVALANAKVGYLLRTSTVEDLSTGEQYNERAAAEWFNANYVATGKGDFIAMNAIPANTDTYTAIWINIDDNGSGALPSEFNAAVDTAIHNFVKAGGNLLLTKRAARVLCEIGRMKKNDNSQYAPSEEWRDACRQFVNAKIAPSYQLRDASHHPIFQDVPVFNSEEGHFLLSSSVSSPDKGYIWTEMYRKDGGKSDNGNIANLNDFQSNWSCQVLAVWGSVTDYIAPVIVEFYPQGDYKGTILSIGTASYKWGTANTNIDNVKTLTSNALSYLDHNGTEIGYYMPYALSELYSTDAYHADFQTAKWFYDNYVVTNKGRFIHKGEAIPSQMTVLWVHNDRVGLDKNIFYTAFGGDTFKDALLAFVSRGGSLYLSKQACYLAFEMGKIYEPENFGNGGYGNHNNDEWSVNAGNLGYSLDASCHQDRSSHPIYTGMTIGTYHYESGTKTIPFETYMLVGLTERTDNNTVWSEMWKNKEKNIKEDNNSTTKLTNFESAWNCQVLGVWGQVQDFCGAGLIEFFPTANTCEGTIIANGFSAYQWGDNNTNETAIGNVKKLTENALTYLSTHRVVVKDLDTPIPSTVNDLVVYQGGSVSNAGNITVNNSITYIRPVVGGSASNALGQWYTFCLPFTPTKCYIYDETDKADYEINSVYLKEGNAANNPQGEGSFYLQTFPRDADNNWTYIGNNGIPSKDTPYIIKFLNASEDGRKGSAWATYFTSNPTVKFKGGAQTVTGTDDGTGGDANGDYSYHVNKTLHKITLSNVYTLNAEGTYFEYDYGGTSTIMPFECYIKATSPAKALARPRIAIGPNKTQEETNTATDVESVYIDSLMPVAVYDLMGRMFYSGQMPETLPQGVWIIRQGSNSFKLINR